MVLVEPRKHHNFNKSNFFRRHSYSGANSVGQRLEEIEPAVDFPVQFNFGSPYSSSLTIFFDFEEPREIEIRLKGNERKIKAGLFSKRCGK